MSDAAQDPKVKGSRVLKRQVDRLRRRFWTHKIYGPYVAEISDPMFQQLVREGLYRAKVFYIGMAAVVVLPNLGRLVSGSLTDLFALAVVSMVAAGVGCSCWTGLTMQCVEREMIYRRTHGKWRWER